VCDYRQGSDSWLDLLTTYTHDMELQAITAPLLISIIHKSPQHPLSLFLACCVITSHSLAMASNNGGPSDSRTQVLSSQPPVWNCLLSLGSKPPRYNISAWTTQKIPCFHCCSPTVALLRICYLKTGMCLPSHCPEMVAVYRATA
jgi:hypothetical protein